MSPIVGIVIWRLLNGDVPSSFPVFTAAFGASCGLVAFTWGPAWLHAHAVSSFPLAYLAMFGWAIAWGGDSAGLWILALALAVLTSVVLVRRYYPDRVQWELTKFAVAAL
ncbi:MAG: hypothetical protein JO291_14935 [Acidimicrobiia bacterium]|nr:hypothetical protein [Acidimicrobiia bacterium]